MADQRFPTAEDSLDHLTLEPVMADVAFVTPSQQPTIVSRGGGGGMLQLIGMVASVMTSAFQVPSNHNSDPQQGASDNNDIIDIGTVSEPVEVPVDESLGMPITVSPVHVTTALWIMALLTMILVIGTVLYKPATGVFFGPNKVAYYTTLAAVFTLGVMEAFTAFWPSRSRDSNRRRFIFGTAALCFSILPFVAIVGISGFSFLEK